MQLSTSKLIANQTCLLKVIFPIKEEHRLRVFENRVLRRIFGPKSEEVEPG
jgi:hypothetical protein